MSEAMLRVRNLKTYFRIGKGGVLGLRRAVVKAVDDVSFEIHQGEVLGLVGESGSGKSTVGRTLTRLEKPTGGSAFFDGQDILKLEAEQFRPFRRHIQMIFQDPYASLNPRLSIESTLAEPLRIHGLAGNRSEAREKIGRMLERVGLEPDAMKRFPHEFSGGQRQRIGIARVMVLAPRLVIADEAVSALDSSIQAQILNLIRRLQRESNVSILFISHDLGVIRHVCDRVAVMQHGRIVESGTKRRIFSDPKHEYTRRLLNAVPRVSWSDLEHGEI